MGCRTCRSYSLSGRHWFEDIAAHYQTQGRASRGREFGSFAALSTTARIELGGSCPGESPPSHFCARASQSLTVRSLLAEARVLPSELHATDQTQPACPARPTRSRPDGTSQSLSVVS